MTVMIKELNEYRKQQILDTVFKFIQDAEIVEVDSYLECDIDECGLTEGYITREAGAYKHLNLYVRKLNKTGIKRRDKNNG